MAFYPLPQLAILTLKGEDTLKFLQGQGTQDYRLLAEKPPQAGAFCNAKGRAVANVWHALLANSHTHLKLITSLSALGGLESHLNKYRPFFRQTSLENEQLNYRGWGVTQPRQWLDQCFGEATLGVWQQSEHFAFELPDDRAQLWIHTHSADYEHWLQRLESQVVLPTHLWQVLDIKAQYAWVEGRDQERFIASDLGLEKIKGISYQKGCYTGQEVIARLHYKGQSKRQLAVLRWQGEEPKSDAVFNDQTTAGDWLNWVVHQGQGHGLALLRASAKENTIFIDEQRHITAELLS